MKVNRELFHNIRAHKKACESCDIQYIETTEYNEWFSTEFHPGSFNTKMRWYSNHGRKAKRSCIIALSKNGSYEVNYYDNIEKIKIELFPSVIKRVVYKTRGETIL